MKIQRVVYLDLELWQEMKKMGYNISHACNEGMKAKLKVNQYKNMSLPELERLKAKRDEINELKTRLKELEDG
jgi:hypothetical protein